MNIGIVTTWHEGGAGYVSRAYRDVLKADGNNVWIYARGGRYYPFGDPVWDMPDITPGRRYAPPGFSKFDTQYIDIVNLEKWLRENDINILIFNEEQNFIAIKRVKELGCVVGSYIDYYTKDKLPQFKIYDFFLCNTKRHYSIFSDFPNSFYIPWGTDTALFKPRPHVDIQKDDTIVFFHSAGFGGINNRKGTDILLKAFQKVSGDCKLIVHSQVPASKYGDEACDLMRRDIRIQFIEKTVRAPGLYHLGDVFVYPSRLEGIGLCVPEALACGLPVITTDNAPMNEFVKDHVNGLLVGVKETRMREDGYYWPEKIADIDDLVQKMQIYVNDKNLLACHKRQARESAEKRLDWMRNASELSNNLQVLLSKFNRKRRRLNLRESIVWWTEAKYVALLTYTRQVAKQLLWRA